MANPLRRRRQSAAARAFTLVMTLAAVLPAAACTGVISSAAPGAPGAASARHSTPAITAAGARQVFHKYVTTAAAASLRSAAPLLALVTGVQRSVLSATLASHGVTVAGAAASSAYASSLTVAPALARYAYGTPSFYLPEAAGYPRFFVASVRRTLTGTSAGSSAGGGATVLIGDVRVPQSGPLLLLFTQASAGASWLLAQSARLPSGVTLPPLATDGSGYIPAVSLSQGSLLARPEDVGPLQAAVADDGPASTATRAVAAGPLTTGIYRGAADHASGLTAPPGDVYQWALTGVSNPEFALRTADGGALVFYAMALTTTVAVPDVIDKSNPVHSGRPIKVPAAVRMLLPGHEPTPLVELQAQQTLSFAAVDPATDAAPGAKISVIAIGGGLTYATAS